MVMEYIEYVSYMEYLEYRYSRCDLDAFTGKPLPIIEA